MLDKIVPKKIINLLDLIRFNKPIGFFLLMWPCWFSMALIPQNQLFLFKWYLYFFLGAFLMRSGGCIINDLVDINLDKKVFRTSHRPLTSNKISILEALLFLFLILLFSLYILLQFNSNAIYIGLASLPLIIIYPFLKRYTHLPQLGLGIVFNWGVLIVAIQFYNSLNLEFLFLYLGCVFWTLAYDTIYAYQDKEDDIKNNIKSTAILFGLKGLNYVKFFYFIFFIIIGFLGFYSSKSILSLVVIILSIFGMNLYLNKWKLEIPQSSNHYFNFNNIIGLFCFLYLIIF